MYESFKRYATNPEELNLTARPTGCKERLLHDKESSRHQGRGTAFQQLQENLDLDAAWGLQQALHQVLHSGVQCVMWWHQSLIPCGV